MAFKVPAWALLGGLSRLASPGPGGVIGGMLVGGAIGVFFSLVFGGAKGKWLHYVYGPEALEDAQGDGKAEGHEGSELRGTTSERREQSQ